MFMHDEGTMVDSLGQAAFAAFLELIHMELLEVILIGALLVTLIVSAAFIDRCLRAMRKHDLDLERSEREALLDLAHRGESL